MRHILHAPVLERPGVGNKALWDGGGKLQPSADFFLNHVMELGKQTRYPPRIANSVWANSHPAVLRPAGYSIWGSVHMLGVSIRE